MPRASRVWNRKLAAKNPLYPQSAKAYAEWCNKRKTEARIRASFVCPCQNRGAHKAFFERQDELLQLRVAALAEARKIVHYMKTNDMIPTEDPRAEEVLSEVVAVVVGKDPETGKHFEPLKERLTAAKIFLDFTKAKPVARTAVTLQSAEDWLDAVADKVND